MSAHPHAESHGGHGHQHGAGGSAAGRRLGPLTVVLGLTTAYMLAEALGGWLTGSLALLADAGHMLTDVLGLAMALFAIRFAQRPATPARTYGFYRGEILAALVNSVVLFAVSGYILVEAWHRLQAPHEIKSLPMLAIAAGGLVVNLIGVKLLHQGASESLNVQGAFLEVLSDLLGSLGVIVAAVIVLLTGWWPADPLVSVLIGLFILPRSWKLLKSALDVLLEATPTHLDVRGIEAAIRQVPGVASVHDLHVWSITSGFVALSGHVLADDRRSSDVLHDVQILLRERFKIEHSTLQVERRDHADDGACCTVDPRCLVVVSGEAALALAEADEPVQRAN
jgi:cobalt-zinc-cadmium efflux system protein